MFCFLLVFKISMFLGIRLESRFINALKVLVARIPLGGGPWAVVNTIFGLFSRKWSTKSYLLIQKSKMFTVSKWTSISIT